MLKKILTSRFASTPPTTEEAELWKEIIKYLDQDIDYFLCIPELMQKYQLSRRSEQNPDWQTTFLKEPVTFLLTNAMMYLNPQQLIALRNALVERTPKEENSEAIDQDDEEEDLYSAVGKARAEHELRGFLTEVTSERADFVKKINKFFPPGQSPDDLVQRHMYMNIRVAAENILILYDQMVERLKQNP